MAALPVLGSLRRLTAAELKPLIKRTPHALQPNDIAPIRGMLERRNRNEKLTKGEEDVIRLLTSYVLSQNTINYGRGRMETPFDDLFEAWNAQNRGPEPNRLRNITPKDLLE